MLPHIRTSVRPRERRRWAWRPPTAETFCGALATDRDITITDARRALRGRGFPICPHCLDHLDGYSANPSTPKDRLP